jgi:uncharacterized membrane protein
MNRLLAQILNILNGVTAVVIIVFMTGASTFGAARRGVPEFVGFAGGLVAGLIAAAFFCGTIALLILIERHLATLARAAEPRAPAPVRRQPNVGTEPTRVAV